MTLQRRNVPPLVVADIPTGEARTQVAALCWRVAKGKPEVLLVTSRETGRWVLPKGWPMAGKTAAEAARREAWEEAGVKGNMRGDCMGIYAYHKVLSDASGVPCVVTVYALKVKSLADIYPESSQRRRQWFNPAKAAEGVDEPELRQLLAEFDPKSLKG